MTLYWQVMSFMWRNASNLYWKQLWRSWHQMVCFGCPTHVAMSVLIKCYAVPSNTGFPGHSQTKRQRASMSFSLLQHASASKPAFMTVMNARVLASIASYYSSLETRVCRRIFFCKRVFPRVALHLILKKDNLLSLRLTPCRRLATGNST